MGDRFVPSRHLRRLCRMPRFCHQSMNWCTAKACDVLPEFPLFPLFTDPITAAVVPGKLSVLQL